MTRQNCASPNCPHTVRDPIAAEMYGDEARCRKCRPFTAVVS